MRWWMLLPPEMGVITTLRHNKSLTIAFWFAFLKFWSSINVLIIDNIHILHLRCVCISGQDLQYTGNKSTFRSCAFPVEF